MRQFKELLEGFRRHFLHHEHGLGDLLENLGVCCISTGNGDDVAGAIGLHGRGVFVPTIRWCAIGEDEDERLPIAFLFLGSFADLAIDAFHEEFERGTEGSRSTGGDVRRIELRNLSQRDDLLRVAVEGDDRQVGGLDGGRIAHEFAVQRADAGFHGFDRCSVHGSGTIGEDVYR